MPRNVLRHVIVKVKDESQGQIKVKSQGHIICFTIL